MGIRPRFNPHSIWGFSEYTQIIPNYNFSGMGMGLGIASKSSTGSGIMIPVLNLPHCHLYIIPFYFVVALPICHRLAFHHSAALSHPVDALTHLTADSLRRHPHSPHGWLTLSAPVRFRSSCCRFHLCYHLQLLPIYLCIKWVTY